MLTDILETLNSYLYQSGNDWITISQAVGNNPIIIAFYIFGCVSIFISFFIISTLIFKSFRNRGFMSVQHKKVARWILAFFFLCGAVFGIHSFAFIYPAYWLYSGLICIAGMASLFTTVIYIKYFKTIKSLPTVSEVLEQQKENEILKKKVEVLQSHIDMWSKSLGSHINILKIERDKLTSEVPKPVIQIDDSSRHQIVETLNNIQDEIESLSSIIK